MTYSGIGLLVMGIGLVCSAIIMAVKPGWKSAKTLNRSSAQYGGLYGADDHVTRRRAGCRWLSRVRHSVLAESGDENITVFPYGPEHNVMMQS